MMHQANEDLMTHQANDTFVQPAAAIYVRNLIFNTINNCNIRLPLFNSHTSRKLKQIPATNQNRGENINYNKKTIEQIGKDLSPSEIQELIFRQYSERHWGIKWEDLPVSISSRVPTKRDNWDDRYFIDKYQGIPVNGYTTMFNNMLDGIKVNVGVSKEEYKKLKCDKMIYTGKPDEFYNFRFGKLPYRSLRFEHVKVRKDNNFSWEKGAVINECNQLPFNRTMDNGVYLNENLPHTILTRDYPEEHSEKNDAIYPKDFGQGMSIYSKYKELIKSEEGVVFLGRLATYKYLDMWMAIKQVMVKLNF